MKIHPEVLELFYAQRQTEGGIFNMLFTWM
jgi:hypothetical protein